MLSKIKRFLKRLVCKHDNKTFIRNIHGDEINLSGGYRSIWICDDCGKYIYSHKLYKHKNGENNE